MTGIVKMTWQISTICIVLLLPYIVLKRPLWLPGLVVVAYTTVGWARLPVPFVGFVRIHLLLVFASVLIIGGILLEGKRQLRPTRVDIALGDRAAVFLVLLMCLMVIRMLGEYLYTGYAFLTKEITDSLVETFLPCLILVLHPGREDAFPQVVQGIALGALLALLPAIMDFSTLADMWAELTGGSIVGYHRIGYRSRGHIAYWATQGAVSLFYLGLLHPVDRGQRRTYLYPVAALLVVFALATQGRTWFLTLVFFTGLYYLRWLRNYDTGAGAGDSLKPLVVFAIGGLLLALVLLFQARFERYALDTMMAELGPSYGVQATRSRRDLLRTGLTAWRENPWLGGGLSAHSWVGYSIEQGTGNLVTRYIGTHYMATDILVQYGIVGGVLAVGFLAATLRSWRRWLKTYGDSRFQEQLSLLRLYWIALLPAALGGAWDPHRLRLVGLLPCAAWLMFRYQNSQAALKGSKTLSDRIRDN